jgi:ATP-dependent Lon protease
METMLLVPVDDSVVFPTMTVTLAIDVGSEERVVLVPRKGEEFASVGTVADVVDRVRLPGGGRAVALEGQHRARIGAARSSCSNSST